MRPSDSVCLLILAAPFAFVLARPRYSILTWRTIAFFSALMSWLAVNYSSWIDGPGNGLSSSVGFLFGWVWGLPFVICLWLMSALLHRIAPRLSDSRGYSVVRTFILLAVVLTTATLVVHGLFGWISRGTAIEIAERHFARSSIATGLPLDASWSWWTWRVHPIGEATPYVDISRSGALIGGQGR